jgi:hypothetical protein
MNGNLIGLWLSAIVALLFASIVGGKIESTEDQIWDQFNKARGTIMRYVLFGYVFAVVAYTVYFALT